MSETIVAPSVSASPNLAQVAQSPTSQVAQPPVSPSSRSSDRHVSWDSASLVSSWCWRRDLAYLGQVICTAAPIWMADLTAVAVSAAIGVGVGTGLDASLFAQTYLPFAGVWMMVLVVAGALLGLYPAVGQSAATELRSIWRFVLGVGVSCIAFGVGLGALERWEMIAWLTTSAALVITLPFARTFARRMASASGLWGIPVLIIGAGVTGQEVYRRLRSRPWLGFRPCGFIDLPMGYWSAGDSAVSPLKRGTLEEAPQIANRENAFCAIFAADDCSSPDRLKVIDDMLSVFPQMYVVSDHASTGRHWTGALELGDLRLLRVTERLLQPGNRWIKRAVDLLLVLAIAPIVVPVVLCLAFLVQISSPGPIFYGHRRIGRNGRPIRVWKLRTMVQNADRVLQEYLARHPEMRAEWELNHKLLEDPRVTVIGRFLRRTSLDELPQLWSVFVGDMSLVGPRPIVGEEVQKYREIFPLYLRVVPGITGLWQVSGRNNLSYEQRVALDARYVEERSPWGDLRILMRTAVVLVTRDGAC